ncbi:unnamed protein product [Amoebophrya sp. A25]|nr:unnamed protein product [Amoebophrya sp. A25]|eukprot:GSA25T00011978001.1
MEFLRPPRAGGTTASTSRVKQENKREDLEQKDVLEHHQSQGFPTPRFIEIIDADSGEEVREAIDYCGTLLPNRAARLKDDMLEARRAWAACCELAFQIQVRLEKKVRRWVANREGFALTEKSDPNLSFFESLSVSTTMGIEDNELVSGHEDLEKKLMMQSFEDKNKKDDGFVSSRESEQLPTLADLAEQLNALSGADTDTNHSLAGVLSGIGPRERECAMRLQKGLVPLRIAGRATTSTTTRTATGGPGGLFLENERMRVRIAEPASDHLERLLMGETGLGGSRFAQTVTEEERESYIQGPKDSEVLQKSTKFLVANQYPEAKKDQKRTKVNEDTGAPNPTAAVTGAVASALAKKTKKPPKIPGGKNNAANNKGTPTGSASAAPSVVVPEPVQPLPPTTSSPPPPPPPPPPMGNSDHHGDAEEDSGSSGPKNSLADSIVIDHTEVVELIGLVRSKVYGPNPTSVFLDEATGLELATLLELVPKQVRLLVRMRLPNVALQQPLREEGGDQQYYREMRAESERDQHQGDFLTAERKTLRLCRTWEEAVRKSIRQSTRMWLNREDVSGELDKAMESVRMAYTISEAMMSSDNMLGAAGRCEGARPSYGGIGVEMNPLFWTEAELWFVCLSILLRSCLPTTSSAARLEQIDSGYPAPFLLGLCGGRRPKRLDGQTAVLEGA